MSSGAFVLGVLAFDGMVLSEVAAAGDIFTVAGHLERARHPGSRLDMRSVVLSADGHTDIATANGMHVQAQPVARWRPDALLVPGFMHVSGEEVVDRLSRMPAELALLQSMHEQGVPLVSACCGGFLLAEAGLLEGRRATTSWWLDATFRRRYPGVALDIEKLVVEDGPVTTAGATTAVLGHLLQMVGRVGGAELATQTARVMLMDPERHSQAPYISRALAERPRHSLSERAEKFLQRELHRELSIGELASQCGTSERSLLRHFRTHYGVSPVQHLQSMRVERAKALLETTHLSFEEVMERCGYRDASSFRKLFKRSTHLTPADYRERFRLRPH